MKPTALRNYALTAAAMIFGTAAAFGQLGGTLSGPVIGYFFSVSDHTVRSLQGMTGSAIVGPAVDLGFPVDQGWSLDGRHMVVSTASNPNLLSVNLETAPASVAAIPVPASPTVAVTSPRGNTAAFYFAGKSAYIVTGLPKSPSVKTVNLGQGDKVVTRMAVSFDGAILVYAVKDENGETLYCWTGAAGPGRVIGAAKAVGGMVVTLNGGVIVADRGANEVFAVWDLRGSASRQFLADARNGVSSPTGVNTSPRNDIYVANAGSVIVLDSGGRMKNSQACNCAPTGASWVKDSLFRLTDRGDQTVYLVDGTADDRILFVPPPLVTP